jgi:hypothetical protein
MALIDARHGVDKNQLLSLVWPDRVVEETTPAQIAVLKGIWRHRHLIRTVKPGVSVVHGKSAQRRFYVPPSPLAEDESSGGGF